MLDAAFNSWRAARDEGASIVITAGDNATANEIALRCRADRVNRGEVTPTGVKTNSGTVGVGDEIVTLRNDRQLRHTTDDFVRNGDRWLVTDNYGDGSLRVTPLDSRQPSQHDHEAQTSFLTLPADYVRQNVALGYALTVHKAQGTTTDRAVVVVDEQMTAPQLYVAMTRGRQHNQALVVTSDRSPEDHGSQPSVDAVELLGAVMRRDTGDRSAHDVMRSNLVTYDNVVMLRELSSEADQVIAQGAGPDHGKEIADLVARGDVVSATSRFEKAEAAARRAETQRLAAEAAVKDAQGQSLRSRLPGRAAQQARKDEERLRAQLSRELITVCHDERAAQKTYEAARHELDVTKRVADELVALEQTQQLRQHWFDDHRDEVTWANDLHVRLEARTAEQFRSGRSQDRAAGGTATTTMAPERFPRAVVEHSVAIAHDARERVQKASRERNRWDAYNEKATPELLPTQARQAEGPSIGR
jgi:hypothetical protein